jgi:hypothetical protein
MLLLACIAGAAEADTVKVTAGVDYSSGKYGGTDDIAQVYIPVSIAYATTPWAIKLTVPYVSVNGPATIIDETGLVTTGPDTSRSGLGDIIASGILYDVLTNDAGDIHVDLGAKVKFGTADEADGLGTGQVDYSVQVDVLKEFERLALFGTVGYKQRTDPSDLDLRNVVFTAIGGDYPVGNTTRAGLLFDYRPSSLSGYDPLSEATVYLQLSLGRGLSIQPYVVAGFSDSSPDWGAGIMFGLRR